MDGGEFRVKLARVVAGLLLLSLSGCSPRDPDRLTLTPVAFEALPGWGGETLAAAMPGLLRQCDLIRRMPPDTPLGGQGEAARLGGTAGQWAAACTAAQRVRPRREAAARAFFQAAFQPYAVADNYRPQPLYTGYYEPELAGDTVPGPLCATPLFGAPADLAQTTLPGTAPGAPARRMFGRQVGGHLARYFDRTAIEDGILDGRAQVLLWLADPVAAFFLQIQGSGRVRLPDGRHVRVGYAAQNGQPYVDIGSLLRRRGELSAAQLSMQDVRQWLYDHPVESRAVMDANPSYVFFSTEPGLRPQDGPLGALGLPLVPGRSLAVDARFVPLGAPVWVDTRDAADARPLQRLMLAQDVGGAIRGPVRADLFFGWGAAAEEHAGRMWGRGGEYLLLPRETPGTGRAEVVAALSDR